MKINAQAKKNNIIDMHSFLTLLRQEEPKRLIKNASVGKICAPKHTTHKIGDMQTYEIQNRRTLKLFLNPNSVNTYDYARIDEGPE